MAGRKRRPLAIKVEFGNKTGGFLAGKIRGKMGFVRGRKRREKIGSFVSFRERIGGISWRSTDFLGSEASLKMRLLLLLKGFVRR